MKTPRLLLLSSAAFFACLGQPAHAGHWDIVLSNSSSSDSYLNPALGEEVINNIIVCPASGDVPNNTKAVATADFYWMPDANNPNDVSPKTLTVTETPYAEYEADSVNQVDDIAVGGSVDDGLGDSSQVYLDPHYGEDDDNWDVYTGMSIKIHGHQAHIW